MTEENESASSAPSSPRSLAVDRLFLRRPPANERELVEVLRQTEALLPFPAGSRVAARLEGVLLKLAHRNDVLRKAVDSLGGRASEAVEAWVLAKVDALDEELLIELMVILRTAPPRR